LKFQQSGEKCIATCVQEPVVLKFKEEAAVNNHAEFPMPLAMRPVTVAQPTYDENSKNVYICMLYIYTWSSIPAICMIIISSESRVRRVLPV
jgi:hypothetical protein